MALQPFSSQGREQDDRNNRIEITNRKSPTSYDPYTHLRCRDFPLALHALQECACRTLLLGTSENGRMHCTSAVTYDACTSAHPVVTLTWHPHIQETSATHERVQPVHSVSRETFVCLLELPVLWVHSSRARIVTPKDVISARKEFGSNSVIELLSTTLRARPAIRRELTSHICLTS